LGSSLQSFATITIGGAISCAPGGAVTPETGPDHHRERASTMAKSNIRKELAARNGERIRLIGRRNV
jgi:hypothetical protein